MIFITIVVVGGGGAAADSGVCFSFVVSVVNPLASHQCGQGPIVGGGM